MKARSFIIIFCLAVLLSVAIVAADSPTSFLITGEVSNSGNPVNDPGVMVINTNTAEAFTVETSASTNYFSTITSSYNVSVNDMLNFSIDGEQINTHTIIQSDIDAGGLEIDLTIASAYLCGDVTCNGIVDLGDVILLANFVGYYPGRPEYYLNSTQMLAGNVTGDSCVDTGDVILLSNYVGYTWYELRCAE
ncbi:MAG: hypothetical protein K8R25_18465 [Methanosarcinales archaeon]|nr:hypothetical protein [Methanosarcinales archaeon]